MDHTIVRNELNHGFKGQTNAITIMDRATGFRWGKGLRVKTGEANLEVIQRFQGPREEDEIKYAYSDAAPEILWASKQMGIRGNHDTSVPGDSQGNGVAENNNRDIEMALQRFSRAQVCRLHIWQWLYRAIVSDATLQSWMGFRHTARVLVITSINRRCSRLDPRLGSCLAKSQAIRQSSSRDPRNQAFSWDMPSIPDACGVEHTLLRTCENSQA